MTQLRRGGAVLAAATLLTATAGPARADGVEYRGVTCSFAASNDGTGIVDADPTSQRAFVTAKWSAGDFKDDNGTGINNSHRERAFVELTCWIQVNNDEAGAPGANAASASGRGEVSLEATMTYRALPPDSVYICTRVEMVHAGTRETFTDDDDDDPINGNQCPLARRFGGQSGYVGRPVSHP